MKLRMDKHQNPMVLNLILATQISKVLGTSFHTHPQIQLVKCLPSISHGFMRYYPLVIWQFAIENGDW